MKALLSRIIRRWQSDCPGITTTSRSPPPRSPRPTPRDSSTRIPPLNPCCVLRCAILLEAFFSFYPFSCLPIFFWGQTCLLICTLHAMLRSNVPSQPYFYLQYPQLTTNIACEIILNLGVSHIFYFWWFLFLKKETSAMKVFWFLQKVFLPRSRCWVNIFIKSCANNIKLLCSTLWSKIYMETGTIL